MNQDAAAAGPGKLHVVRWRREAYERALQQPREQPIPRLLRAFLDRGRAEAYCLDLEQGRRSAPAHANPFLALPGFRGPLQPDQPYDHFYIECLDMKWMTRFSEPILNDWLLDAGLTPPETIHLRVQRSTKVLPVRDWFSWWETNAPQMTELQRCRVWQALDQISGFFFEAIAVEWED
jgi:hypothetical protein